MADIDPVTRDLLAAARQEFALKRKLLFTLIGLMALLTALFVYYMAVAWYRASVPATDWYDVTVFEVPDHVSGEDVSLVYGQTVSTEFAGRWTIEYVREEADGWWPVCSNSGRLQFEPADTFARVELKMSEFMERTCSVTPARYRIRASMTMTKPVWPPKLFSTMSNTFEVKSND